jgi:hypothetical protein
MYHLVAGLSSEILQKTQNFHVLLSSAPFAPSAVCLLSGNIAQLVDIALVTPSKAEGRDWYRYIK